MRIVTAIYLLLLSVAFVPARAATTFYVSTSGSDTNPGTQVSPWRTIQKACNAAVPGSTVLITAGTYNEKVKVHVSGTAAAGPITIANNPGDHVVVDGHGKSGTNIFLLQNCNYVTISGLEITNDIGVHDGSGIRVLGYGDHITLANNTIHHITGHDAMGITVYGTSAHHAISHLTITGNAIYDCQPAQSETLTLNGNVEHFVIAHNLVHDVNNIGIDMIGGEGTCPDKSKDAARFGICSDNIVYNARSNYGGGYGAGIYVDTGHDIIVTRNSVTQSDLGIEVGCEHHGRVAYNVTVADNVLYENDKAGLVFGGYDRTVGVVERCTFSNNTLYHNDQKHTGVGELWIQVASHNLVENNILFADKQDVLLYGDVGSLHNNSNYNLFFCEDGPHKAQFAWNAKSYTGFGVFQAKTGQDANSLFSDPQLTDAATFDFHIPSASPAVNSGDPAFSPFAGEVDYYGEPRVQGGRVDIGAAEGG